MDLDYVSVNKQAKKEFGQYPAILTSHLVNNPNISTSSAFMLAFLLVVFFLLLLLFLMFPHDPRRIGASSHTALHSGCGSFCHVFNYFLAWSGIFEIFHVVYFLLNLECRITYCVTLSYFSHFSAVINSMLGKVHVSRKDLGTRLGRTFCNHCLKYRFPSFKHENSLFKSF